MIEIVKWGQPHFYNDYLLSCTDKINGADDIVYKEIIKILKTDHGVSEGECLGFETTQGVVYFVKRREA